MKRIYALAALAMAVLVAVAVNLAQRSLDDDTTAKPEDPSRSYSSELNDQGKIQAEQMELALEEQEKLAHATANPHELVVTIRDELPLDVWNDSCHMTASAPPTLGVFQKDYTPVSGPVALPATAKPLPGGGCEATVTVAVPDFPAYNVGLIFEGRGISDGKAAPSIKHEGRSQKVTIVE